MLTKFQEKQFRKRFRNENADQTAEKIAKDHYLSFIYRSILDDLLEGLQIPAASRASIIVEIGSAGGITKRIYPEILTCDVRKFRDVDRMIFDNKLPFDSKSLQGIIGKDVLHHIPDIKRHLEEVYRTLKVGGSAIYSEPNWNFLSRFIYVFIHPEPFIRKARDWGFDSNDPMYSNQALPYIVFVRDSDMLKLMFPDLTFEVLQPTIALSFLFSGGVYSRTRIPSWFLLSFAKLERKSKIWMRFFGLNRIIRVTKIR
jgi:SAM-dependent methyltransferase